MKLEEASILVVDDEPALRDIFAKWLRAMGCQQVQTAANGGAALELLTGEAFDLLITDVRMPVMDGVSLVRRLAVMGVSIPSIVFVSGFGDVDQREMYALGVEAFLAKPLRLEDLKTVTERALRERHELWLERMEPPPRQQMVVAESAQTPGSVEGVVTLGRGGFKARHSGVLSVGRVAFRCRVENRPTELAGEGYVRWRSKTDESAGVEFAYLETLCREWVLEELAARKPREFIPE